MLSLHRTFLAVDYDRRQVRLVEFSVQRSGTVRIIRQVNAPIGQDVSVTDPDGFGRFLAELIDRQGIKARRAIFAVGRDSAMLHHLDVPATPEDELADLVRFRVSQELPFAIEEAVADYVITSRDQKGCVTSVLAGVVRHEHLDYLRRVGKAASLRIKRIDLRPYANFIACRSAGMLAEGPALFIELGADAVEIAAFSETASLFSRTAGLAAEGDKGVIDNALLQVQRTLPAYNAGPRYTELTQVIVSGDTGVEDVFLERVAEQLKLDGRKFSARSSHSTDGDCTCSACYGLAAGQCCEKTDRFDFLDPQRAVDPAARRTRTIQLVAAGLIVLLIAGIVGSNRLQSARQAELRQLKRSNSRLKKELDQFDRFRRQVEGVTEWRRKKMNWLKELAELTDRLPDTEDAYLTRIVLAEKTKGDNLAGIDINGRAKSVEIITRLLDQINTDARYELIPGPQTDADTSKEYAKSFKFKLIIGPEKENAGDKSQATDGTVPPAGPR